MRLEFCELDAESVDKLTPYYGKRHDQTCDSTIFDSYLWGEYCDVRYCIRDNKAVLWLLTVEEKKFAALPVCSMEDLPVYMAELEQYFNEELHIPLEIHLADEPAVEYLKLPADRYCVEELFDARDYLYDAKALQELTGKKLRKKKNHINAFLKEYEGRYEYRTLHCSDKLDIWNFLDRWSRIKEPESESRLDYEVEGIHRILNNCSRLHVKMGGIYIDGQLEAFSMGTYNETEKMAIIHIEKANPEIRGAYQMINRLFLIHEFPQAEIVNREDDMGLEGLRHAKMSYDPIGFAKKFRIRQLWSEENKRDL